LHSSVKDNPFFHKVKNISIDKMSVFKNGALNINPPKHIKDSDFEYLMSKFPFLMGLHEDYLRITDDTIFTAASGEEAKKLHEIVGVGVAIQYSIALLNLKLNEIKRIVPPEEKQKILDFSFDADGKAYELECKGTSYKSKVSGLVKSILSKKQGKDLDTTRFGCVTILVKEGDAGTSSVVVCDDFSNTLVTRKTSMMDYLDYYSPFLSMILDNREYNKFVKKKKKLKAGTLSLKVKMFEVSQTQGEYTHRNLTFLGQYFDRRLVVSEVDKEIQNSKNITELFNGLTTRIGRKKYFLGLEYSLLKALASHDYNFLQKYELDLIERNDHRYSLSQDGILIARSLDEQKEKSFQFLTDKVVKTRLKMVANFVTNSPEVCGQPCRSREKRGKPCEIKTFRGACHYHR